MSIFDDRVGNLIRTADAVVDAHGGLRTNGKMSSLRTQEYTKQVMRESCRRLHRLGFYLENVSGLGAKHIEALVKDWHRQKLSNKTMQNQFSRLKIFCGWLGKSGIVDNSGVGVSAYLPGVDPAALKVSTVAQTSRSWTGNGVDVIDVLRRATLEDQRFGAMLTMGIAFGLRKKKMLRINLWSSDKGTSLNVEDSVGKNGKFRPIVLEVEEYGRFQRWALDKAKALCKKREVLGWSGLTFKQSENRFYHYCKRIGLTKAELGVTTHSGRTEFMENMAMLRGLLPPTLGGSTSQMGKDQRKEISLEISRLAGHDDEHVITAYYGSFRKLARMDGIGPRFKTIIIDAETEAVGSIHCNPPVIKAADGSYRKKSEMERQETVITVVIEQSDLSDVAIGIHDFVLKFPKLEDRIRRELDLVGLGAVQG